ncbi:hypothetical protein CLAIMM_04414 [Cladophialophora immunda]|nr:hypothetical protein CLAIMM_04414 [Cladophialophora immunda]
MKDMFLRLRANLERVHQERERLGRENVVREYLEKARQEREQVERAHQERERQAREHQARERQEEERQKREHQEQLVLRHKLKKRMRELRKMREAQQKKADALENVRQRVQRSVDRIVKGHSDQERRSVREKYLKRHEELKKAAGSKYDPTWKRSEFANWDFGLPGPNGEREINPLDLMD